MCPTYVLEIRTETVSGLKVDDPTTTCVLPAGRYEMEPVQKGQTTGWNLTANNGTIYYVTSYNLFIGGFPIEEPTQHD